MLPSTGPEPKPNLPGDTRTFRVWLDPNQYQQDMTRTMDGAEVLVISTQQTSFYTDQHYENSLNQKFKNLHCYFKSRFYRSTTNQFDNECHSLFQHVQYLWFFRMCMRHLMWLWGGSPKRTISKLSWRPYGTWWTPNVLYRTGYMTWYSVTDNQMLLTTQSKWQIFVIWSSRWTMCFMYP